MRNTKIPARDEFRRIQRGPFLVGVKKIQFREGVGKGPGRDGRPRSTPFKISKKLDRRRGRKIEELKRSLDENSQEQEKKNGFRRVPHH
jgi:hypothetical protein